MVVVSGRRVEGSGRRKDWPGPTSSACFRLLTIDFVTGCPRRAGRPRRAVASHCGSPAGVRPRSRARAPGRPMVPVRKDDTGRAMMPAAAARWARSRSSVSSGSHPTRWMPVSARRTSSRPARSRFAASTSAACRSAYSPRIRRRWRVKWPSAMKSATTACSISEPWPRASARAVTNGSTRSEEGHEIADANGGKEHLAEAAHVDHAPGAVEAVERGERPAAVLVLAVVVVLQHPEPMASGVLEQDQSPGQAHRHAQRKLMRRRQT